MSEIFAWVNEIESKAKALQRKLSVYVEVAEVAADFGEWAGTRSITIQGVDESKGSFGSAPWTPETFNQELEWLSTGRF